MKEGWTYLASVIDLYSRKIVGYAYGKAMTAELNLKAVEKHEQKENEALSVAWKMFRFICPK